MKIAMLFTKPNVVKVYGGEQK